MLEIKKARQSVTRAEKQQSQRQLQNQNMQTLFLHRQQQSQAMMAFIASLTKKTSLSQNCCDTFVSPCPLNVGVQGLVTEPR